MTVMIVPVYQMAIPMKMNAGFVIMMPPMIMTIWIVRVNVLVLPMKMIAVSVP